jgi:hypothetical protein
MKSYSNIAIEKAKHMANSLHKSNIKYFPCPSNLNKWIGLDNIYLKSVNNKKEILDKYSMLKGDYSQIQIINHNTMAYKDHVSRIYTEKTNNVLPDAIYTLPTISNKNHLVLDISKPKKQIEKQAIKIVSKNSNTILTQVPEPFTYEGMESGKGLDYPVSLGYPKFLPKLSNINYKFENVLHLPIKISLKCEKNFRLEQRVDSNGNPVTHNKIYLPKELEDLADYIQLLAQVELNSNPYFKLDYYMFLSISDGNVEPGNTHRRGGWHIDGHQGYERLVNSGVKHLIDRQYILCDTLPTEFYPMKFDFDKLRKSHILDSVNIQDQIEKMTGKQEQLYPKLVSTISPNQINFLTPYMVHRGQTNNTDSPIARKFIRLICSTYSRDRLGDTINPIIGPLNPLKVKTITDIYEVK